MTTSTDGPEQRIAIWSLSARVIGAYFVIFLIQYIPGAAFEAYSRFSQRAADEALVHATVEVVKACGPIGVGAATNALAIAMIVETVMVLAKIIGEHQRAAGIREGFQAGVQQERKRKNAKIRALAKKYGIPEDELPIEDEDEDK